MNGAVDEDYEVPEALQVTERDIKRNAPLEPWVKCVTKYEQCRGCGRRISYGRDVVNGQPVGQFTRMGPHCTTCHSYRHNACQECGACLPDWRMWKPWRERAQRLDAQYCSNACRQKAYRKRKNGGLK